MSSDDRGQYSSHDNNDEETFLDRLQQDHGDEEYNYTNPRYIELGADEWPHRDPDRLYGGIAWGESVSYTSYEQARDAYIELIENQSNITGSGYRELGDIHMYPNQYYQWTIDYHIFIEGATGDS